MVYPMAKCFKIFIILFCLPIFIFAQYDNPSINSPKKQAPTGQAGQDISFEHLSVDHGLSNNIVYSILQDSRGFMWFGTEDGLNKYDGYDFTVYRHDPEDSLSISDNWIWTLHESHYGGKHVLWVGTHNSGLNRLDLKTEQFTHFKNNLDDPQSLSSDRIASIYEDSFGDLWIGTMRGINKLDRVSEKFNRYQYNPNDTTTLSSNNYCLIIESPVAKDSILWIGTWDGLNKFDRKTEKFTHYKHDRNNPNSLSNNNINNLFFDSSGILWISAFMNGGLNNFNTETEHFTRFQHDAGPIIEDKFQGKKVLWMNSFNGLDRFDLDTEQFSHYKHDPNDPTSLCDNRLVSLYKDKTGNIWIGTYGSGLIKFYPERQKFEHLRQETGNLNSISNNVVMSVTEAKYYGPNVFWIGTKNGGLDKYDRNSGNFTHYRHDPGNANSLSSDFVFSILESQYQDRNELWIGTLSGLDKYDLKTKKFTRYQHAPGDPYSISDNLIRSLYEDKNGTLWIGTRDGGLNKFDRTSGKFNRKKYNIGEALSIIEDKTGTLWAGTSRGLFEYNKDTDDFTHFKHDPGDPNSLSHNSVLSIYEDKSSRLWIGSSDGFNLYNRETNKFTKYMVKDGLPSGVINGILEDDFSNLWLSTNHGLSMFNPRQKTFRNYELLDGLQSNQFMIGASCLSQKGEMLFGGVNGFNVFHPDSIRDNPHIPNVYLTDFKIFNKSVNVKTGDKGNDNDKYYLPKHISNISEIILSYKESVFSFEFAALDYHGPQKNQYAYKMEGVDPDWVLTEASRRFATYTNLDPGEYIFQVKGSNNDGVWNEEGTSVKVIITPPWWKTNLAYLFYLFFFGFVVFAVWRFQTNRLKIKHELELEHVHAEKLEEVDRLKSRFFANISHEFRTPLTLIKGPVKQIMDGEFTGSLKKQCKMILRNSDRLLGLINQILDLSKLESGGMKLEVSETNIVKYLKGLVLSFASLAERKKIKLEFKGTQKSIVGYLDLDKLEKITGNLLSNAFKFTPEGGMIEVAVSEPTPNPSQEGILEFPSSKGCPENRDGVGKGMIQISVSNTGVGIPPEQLDKIFDRFYQADDNYKKDSEGRGIGLALTKELVEVCHGGISVESGIIGEQGKGEHRLRKESFGPTPFDKGDFITTFTVILPVAKEYFKEDEIVESTTSQISPLTKGGLRGVPESTEDYTEVEEKEAKSKTKKSAPQLLIVEDNPDVANYISSFMENDYRILTAENGKIGLKETLDKYPDLIISDVMMPEMDGFELCQKIKSDERISHIPVILLTAKADLNSRIEGLEFGADDYVTKPFEADELKVRSKNLIDQRQRLREKFARLIDLQPNEIVVTSIDEEFIKRLMAIFEDHISEPEFSTEQCAREVGMSRSSLNNKLRALTNQSTHEFIRLLRLKRAAKLLKKAAGSVAEIAYQVGFNNTSHFAKAFRQHFGQSPSDFANHNNSQGKKND
jgi:signal transduction histidine kinase/ligand-binding sensor domain-containing protein/DNA-binding response OmpR family regulator